MALPEIRVALDWTPNANHVGFYVAAAKGWFAEAGVNVRFVSPEDSGYTLTPAKAVLEAGLADLAVAPTETVIAYASPKRAEDGPRAPRLVAVAALLQQDTSALAVLESSGITRPRDLDGKTYASYAARYESGIVKAVVRADGGKGDFTETVPARLDCWDKVTGGEAHATWIFEPHEGVIAAQKGVRIRTFRVGDYGVPYGYSPVLLAAPAFLEARGEDLRRFLAAAARGYAFAAAQPEDAADLLRTASGHVSLANEAFVRASVRAAAHAFLQPSGAWGLMEAQRWEAFLSFLAAQGLLTGRDGAQLPPELSPKAAQLFTNAYLPAPHAADAV